MAILGNNLEIVAAFFVKRLFKRSAIHRSERMFAAVQIGSFRNEFVNCKTAVVIHGDGDGSWVRIDAVMGRAGNRNLGPGNFRDGEASDDGFVRRVGPRIRINGDRELRFSVIGEMGCHRIDAVSVMLGSRYVGSV